ncbi:MAG: hypothetical protein UZ07_CHB004002140 [Chlorobi bacterium OLB7]|nr:MAG: hypothetical protein UZ07_CHB004002140 [Chlorobi bacterium OLB7]
MLQKTFRQPRSLARSRQRCFPTMTIDLQHPAFGMRGGQDEIFVETYIADPHDTSAMFNGAWRFSFTNVPKLLGVRHNLIPSIQEHNGGRFKVPELTLDQQGLRDYADIIQRFYFGQYSPGKLPWLMDRGAVFNLGRGAQLSRQTGRRLIQLPSSYYSLWIRGKKLNNTMVTDTMAGHAPEPAELRALVHMGLAYGTRGIVWWWVGSSPIMQSWGDDDNWTRMSDLGAVGTTTADTVQNRVGEYPLREWNGTVRRVPALYLGWGNNSRELKAIHAQLRQLAPTMMRLRWRQGYSIHHTAERPGFDNDALHPRPLPADEIVTAVTAAAPRHRKPRRAARNLRGAWVVRPTHQSPRRLARHQFHLRGEPADVRGGRGCGNRAGADCGHACFNRGPHYHPATERPPPQRRRGRAEGSGSAKSPPT